LDFNTTVIMQLNSEHLPE